MRERGLIEFTEGVQNSCSPKYRILEIHSCKNATASATARATDSATAGATNIKNNNRDKYNYSTAFEKKNRGYGTTKQNNKDLYLYIVSMEWSDFLLTDIIFSEAIEWSKRTSASTIECTLNRNNTT